MDLRITPALAPRYATPSSRPHATTPAGPRDSVDISAAAPTTGLLDRFSLGMMTSSAHVAASALAPSFVSGPSAAATHAANVALLAGLEGKGATIYRRRRFLFTWFRPIDPEKAATLLEKRDKAGDAAKGPLFVSLGRQTGVPLTSSADLRLLDALEGSGSTSGVKDEPLARAMHDLTASGFKFGGQVDRRWVIRGNASDYWNSTQEVGALGAYKALSGEIEGVTALTVEGRESLPVGDREGLLAINYFLNNGAATGMKDPDMAAGMRLVNQRYPIRQSRGNDVLQVYIAQVGRDLDKREVRVSVTHDFSIVVKRDALLDGQKLLGELDGLRERFDRMSGLDRGAAMKVLTRLRERGTVDDDHEKAFMTIGGLAKGIEDLPKVYDRVTAAAMPGETVAQAADAFAELTRTEFAEAPSSAADAFVFLRTRFADLGGGIGDDAKAARFVKMVRMCGSGQEAAAAWSTLEAGTADDARFEASFAAAQRLKGRSSSPDGLALYAGVRGAMASGDALDDAVGVMERVKGCFEGYRGVESSVNAFRFTWSELKRRGPADMPVEARRERYLGLLGQFRDNRTAEKAWSLLEDAPTTATFDDGLKALQRLSTTLDRGAQLFDVFTGLESHLKGKGGFSGRECQRWLDLIEATGSWDGAQQGYAVMERMPAEVAPDARLALYQALARANGKKLAQVENDLAFVERFAAAPSEITAVGERYARLLGAAGGRTADARQALAMCDGYLAADGPSGLSAVQRQTLHGRLLAVGFDNSGAHRLLRSLEDTPRDEGTAERTVGSLETLTRSFGEFRQSAPLQDALNVWDGLADRAESQVERAETFAAIAEAVSTARLAHSLLTSKVLPLSTLGEVREACGQLVELSRLGKEAVPTWIAMRPVAERIGWTRACEGLQAFNGESRDAIAAFGAMADTTAYDHDFVDAMKWGGAIGRRQSVQAGIATYGSIRAWADGLDWNGGTAARVERWCGAVAGSLRLEGLPQALQVVSVPAGRESLEAREKALLTLAEALPDDAQRWTAASALYGAVAAGALRGDDLVENASHVAVLLGFGLSSEQGAEVYRRLQNDRAAGGRFAQAPLSELVRSFGEQFVTAHLGETDRAAAERLFHGQRRDATGNALDAALNRMHGVAGRVAESIEHDDEAVVIGGIRVSKRS